MKHFVGRDAELNFLRQHYEREESRLLVVYGGRGFGKSRLLQEFGRDKSHSYYLARACSDREQRWQWGSELRERQPEIRKYPEYEELLAVAGASEGKEKHILVIDEFHHMIKGGGEFFQKLVAFLNGRNRQQSVLVVLCTSASGWVENSMVGKIGSLAAAVNGFLKLRELSFDEIRRLFPEYQAREAMGTYAVLGGVPGYWMNFSAELTLRENLIQNVLRRESRLYGELSLFMEQELREPAVYNTLLAALAKDCNKLNDIYRHTGFSRAKISVYLKNLMELDLVEKVYSFDTPGRENAQKGIYRIKSAYVRFYYRFLFPNQSLLQLETPEAFYAERIAEAFERFAEESYRKICRDRMALEFKAAGEWLGKTGSLDAVAMDDEGEYCVALCAYASKLTLADYEWLLFSLKKARLGGARVRLYGESGFTGELVEAAERDGVRLMRILEE